jgi:hypothetical protein
MDRSDVLDLNTPVTIYRSPRRAIARDFVFMLTRRWHANIYRLTTQSNRFSVWPCRVQLGVYDRGGDKGSTVLKMRG